MLEAEKHFIVDREVNVLKGCTSTGLFDVFGNFPNKDKLTKWRLILIAAWYTLLSHSISVYKQELLTKAITIATVFCCSSQWLMRFGSILIDDPAHNLNCEGMGICMGTG